MLVFGQSGQPAVTLSADIYSWGVVMMELIGTQHPEFPNLKSPRAERGSETARTQRPSFEVDENLQATLSSKPRIAGFWDYP